MAHLYESHMSLRVGGEMLIPDEVTRLLGAPPTTSRKKGDVQYHSKDGRETIAKIGLWMLSVEHRTPEDLDGQVAEILGKLTLDLDVWAQLARRFEIDVFCGLFMRESNEGMTLSAKTMLALGARGIELGLDIYDPTPLERRAR